MGYSMFHLFQLSGCLSLDPAPSEIEIFQKIGKCFGAKAPPWRRSNLHQWRWPPGLDIWGFDVKGSFSCWYNPPSPRWFFSPSPRFWWRDFLVMKLTRNPGKLRVKAGNLAMVIVNMVLFLITFPPFFEFWMTWESSRWCQDGVLTTSSARNDCEELSRSNGLMFSNMVPNHCCFHNDNDVVIICYYGFGMIGELNTDSFLECAFISCYFVRRLRYLGKRLSGLLESTFCFNLHCWKCEYMQCINYPNFW